MPNDDTRNTAQPSDAPAGPHHIADEEVADIATNEPGVQSPTTDTGLPVEDQIRKEWDPNKNGGLPTPVPRALR